MISENSYIYEVKKLQRLMPSFHFFIVYGAAISLYGCALFHSDFGYTIYSGEGSGYLISKNLFSATTPTENAFKVLSDTSYFPSKPRTYFSSAVLTIRELSSGAMLERKIYIRSIFVPLFTARLIFPFHAFW